MEFECFKFKGNPFIAQLSIEENLIYCPIREKPIVNNPEELVRQSLLSFLIKHCTEYNVKCEISIAVEHESMDIAIYLMINNEDFNPNIPPILIIETKRNNINLDTISNEDQLTKYIELKKCRFGILFNGNSAFFYEKQQQGCQKKEIFDFSEILEIIKKQTVSQKKIFDVHYQYFNQAILGHYESFLELIKIYGLSNSKIKFLYRKNKQLLQSTGIIFHIKENEILFRNQGFYTKKCSSITRNEFDRLISIKKI